MWVQQGHILSPYLFNLYAKYIMQKARLDESQAGIKIVEEKYQPQICRSVQFSHSVTSISWWPHGLQHARPPYPSPTPGVYPNPCPLSQWCHPTMSSSVILFSSCPQYFPASGSFPKRRLFTSGDQSIGASASILPMNIQGWFPLGLTGLISLLSKGLARVFSSTTV